MVFKPILHSESLYAITGFGDGSHLLHFLNESSSGTNFLATEKTALLRETLARFDSMLLSNERFILGVGELDDVYFADIQGAALSGVADVNSIVFSPFMEWMKVITTDANELIRQY